MEYDIRYEAVSEVPKARRVSGREPGEVLWLNRYSSSSTERGVHDFALIRADYESFGGRHRRSAKRNCCRHPSITFAILLGQPRCKMVMYKQRIEVEVPNNRALHLRNSFAITHIHRILSEYSHEHLRLLYVSRCCTRKKCDFVY